MRTFFLFFLYVVAGVTGQGFSTTFLQNTLFGGDHSDFGVASWSDQSRGVRYVVGQTYSSTFSGVPPLSGQSSVGAPDILLIKLDQATDSLIWYTVVGTARSDQPKAVTGDSDGNIWITGSTFGSFGDSDKSEVSRGFVMKINSDGTTLLTLTVDDCQPSSIDSDANGHIWIAGSATTTNADNSDDAVNEDVAILVYSTNGDQLSSRTFGGAASDAAKTIAVADNIVAVGGTTFSSDFPVTQGDRECEFCSGVGFLMTLTFDADNGIQQTYSSYIIGMQQQSLSVVDITFDSNNNLYLAMYDDSNAMGAYIQQVKSDFSLGWVSENSDAFWKIEYLPLIDALYTIGSFSTPTDYATFYVMDTKTGAHIYSSKALTGALVDASVYSVDESTYKISMIGTLQKDLRISYHGRTYMTTHKSDDILIVSLTIRSLAVAASAQPKSRDVSLHSEKRDEADFEWSLWNHKNGFLSVNNFYQDYVLVEGGVGIVLHWDKGHDYDILIGSAFVYYLTNIYRQILGLLQGTWGTTFVINFQLGFSTTKAIDLNRKQFGGVSHFEFHLDHKKDVNDVGVPYFKIIARNQGRALVTDNVAWTLDIITLWTVIVDGESVAKQWTESITMDSRPHADLFVTISFDLDRKIAGVASEQLRVYASLDEEVDLKQVRPAGKEWIPISQHTFDTDEFKLWQNDFGFFPSIHSMSTIETHLIAAAVGGLTEKIIILPIPLNTVLPVTGASDFPLDKAVGGGVWTAQVAIFDTDSLGHLFTKIAFPLAPQKGVEEGQALAGPMLYIFTKPYLGYPKDIKDGYKDGYYASVGSWGTGSYAGWSFPSKVTFTKGTKYYLYIVDGLFAEDNLCISDITKIDQLSLKRSLRADPVTDQPQMTYNKKTNKWVTETTISLVYTVYSRPDPKSNPFYLPTSPPSPTPPGVPTPPNPDGNGAGDPWFVGFNGAQFEFKGQAGKIYNIYNDPWVNVNSLFGFANDKTQKGTVMHTVGVSVGEHNLFFDIANRENRRYFDVVINGVTTRVGHAVQHLSGCVDIQYNTKVILVSTPRHSVRLTIEWGHNWHIDVPYFDVHIHHPEEDNSKIGGVLGQTAHLAKGQDIDKTEDDFTVDDIFSFEKSKFYNLQSLDC